MEEDRFYSAEEHDRFDATWTRTNEDGPWVLSDRDAWYANPAYTGPPHPHPEDSGTWIAIAEGDMTLEDYADQVREAKRVQKARDEAASAALRDQGDNIPF
tara:strand:- start:206 stop:508 length:303 start_codon:yes stop_codon:yes gene_type:complete